MEQHIGRLMDRVLVVAFACRFEELFYFLLNLGLDRRRAFCEKRGYVALLGCRSLPAFDHGKQLVESMRTGSSFAVHLFGVELTLEFDSWNPRMFCRARVNLPKKQLG